MICFPNAKINLGLNIVSKRKDSYHNIETIFYPIGLKDALEVVPSQDKKTYRFFSDGIDVGANTEGNLVIRALSILGAEKFIPSIDIYLLKAIPFGAGFGGGSSDAAFMLKLLNKIYSLELTSDELKQFAMKLGADCSFFINNKPSFASGIGDKLETIDLSLDDYYLVLVKPDIFVSSKEAYIEVIPKEPTMSLKEIVKMPISKWSKYMHNDFETSIFKKYPLIGEIKQGFYDNGAVYASMTGSGSAVYGLFDKKPDINFSDSFSNCFVWRNYM